MQNVRKTLHLFASVVFVAGSCFSFVACGDEGSSVSSDQGNGDSLSQADSLKYLDYYGMACSAEEEGLYKAGKSLMARYPDGSVMEKDLYYKCESGKWTYSDNPGPENPCTAELEGEISSHTVYSGRFHSTYYYRCESKTWNAISYADAQCPYKNVQVGDSCSYTTQQSVAWENVTKVTVYFSEEGKWVSYCEFFGCSSSAETIEIDGKLYEEIECDPWAGDPKSGCSEKDESKLAYCERTKYHGEFFFKCSNSEWSKLSYMEAMPPTESCDDANDGSVIAPHDSLYYARCESGSWKEVNEAQYQCQGLDAKDGNPCTFVSCTNNFMGGQCSMAEYVYSEEESAWIKKDENSSGNEE